jgi:hypothetical protein
MSPDQVTNVDEIVERYTEELRILDGETDAFHHVWHERAKRLSGLHAQAQQDNCSPAVEFLAWEFQVAILRTGSISMLERERQGFENVHQSLGSDPALDYLTTRVDAPGYHVRARVRSFLWEYGGTSRRRAALGAASAHLALAEFLVQQAPEREHGWLPVGDALARATDLARSSNQKGLMKSIATKATEFIKQLADAGNSRWVIDMTVVLTSLVDVLSDDEKQEVAAQIESAAKALLDQSSDHLGQVALRVRRQFAQACRWSDAVIHEIDRSLAESLIAEGNARMAEGNPLAARFGYDNAVQVLQEAGQEQELLAKARQSVRDATRQGIKHLRPIVSDPIEIPREEVERVVASVVEAPVPECLHFFAVNPALQVTRSEATAGHESSVANSPLSSVFPTLEIRHGAQALAPTDAEDARRLALFRFAKLPLKLQEAMYLGPILEGLISRNDLSPGAVSRYLIESGHVGEDALPLIAVGLERLWDRDWPSALHILVPQFEDLLRQLALRCGRETMRPHSIPGISVEAPLRAIQAELRSAGVDDDFLFMVELQFDLFGENLRNEIGHGLARISTCTIGSCARVLQLYLHLCEFRLEAATPARSNVAG